MDLQGRHVVVTGASGALGEAVMPSLRARGATLHVPPGRVDDEAEVVRFYADLPGLWASVHLVGGFSWGPITETGLDEFERLQRLNASTCWLCCREAVRAMTGGGRIVNVGARPVVRPAANVVAYAASKAAVGAITTCLAEEVRDAGILVNAVLPSILDTPANRAAMPDADFGSWPRPEEVAETIAWLVSPANTLTSGALVPVFGRG